MEVERPTFGDARRRLERSLQDSFAVQQVDNFEDIWRLALTQQTQHLHATISEVEVGRLAALPVPHPVPVITTQVGQQAHLTDYKNIKTTYTTTFGNIPPGAKLIRFVRAAQLKRTTYEAKCELYHTVPGYLSYSRGHPVQIFPTSVGSCRCHIDGWFGRAQWAFDGPQNQFRDSGVNVDTPGTIVWDKPWALKADFLMVLYQPETWQILQTTRSRRLFVWCGSQQNTIVTLPEL